MLYSSENDHVPNFSNAACLLTSVADELNPILFANKRLKAFSVPCVFPGFSIIIASNWLLHIAILSCTVICQVHLMKPLTGKPVGRLPTTSLP